MYTTHDSSDEEITAKAEKLWALMASYISNDVESIQRSIVNHVEYTLACTRFNFDNRKAYLATSHSCVAGGGHDSIPRSWAGHVPPARRRGGRAAQRLAPGPTAPPKHRICALSAGAGRCGRADVARRPADLATLTRRPRPRSARAAASATA